MYGRASKSGGAQVNTEKRVDSLKEVDMRGRLFMFEEKVVPSAYAEVAGIPSRRDREAIVAHFVRSENNAGLAAMVALVQRLTDIPTCKTRTDEKRAQQC